jgi:hypothetical protein
LIRHDRKIPEFYLHHVNHRIQAAFLPREKPGPVAERGPLHDGVTHIIASTFSYQLRLANKHADLHRALVPCEVRVFPGGGRPQRDSGEICICQRRFPVGNRNGPRFIESGPVGIRSQSPGSIRPQKTTF